MHNLLPELSATTSYDAIVLKRLLSMLGSMALILTLAGSPVCAAEDKADRGNVWKSSSFLDFVDGTLTDGGANMYISKDGTLRLINL